MHLAVASTSRQMLFELVEGGRDGHTLPFFFILFRDVRTIYYLTTILTGKKTKQIKTDKKVGDQKLCSFVMGCVVSSV